MIHFRRRCSNTPLTLAVYALTGGALTSCATLSGVLDDHQKRQFAALPSAVPAGDQISPEWEAANETSRRYQTCLDDENQRLKAQWNRQQLKFLNQNRHLSPEEREWLAAEWRAYEVRQKAAQKREQERIVTVVDTEERQQDEARKYMQAKLEGRSDKVAEQHATRGCKRLDGCGKTMLMFLGRDGQDEARDADKRLRDWTRETGYDYRRVFADMFVIDAAECVDAAEEDREDDCALRLSKQAELGKSPCVPPVWPE